MNRKLRIFGSLVFTLAVLGGCSSAPTVKTSKSTTKIDRIQGKAQVLTEAGGASDAALNAGGPSIYLWEGAHRYRLFLRNHVEVVHGDQYVAEGINAQKVIDSLGDPAQGKNGYPLPSSCANVVKMAWTTLAFDEIDADTSLLCGTIKRYPARTIFLVTRLRPATSTEGSAVSAQAVKDKEAAAAPEVSIPAAKQRASLIEGPTVQPAPLWQPEGGAISCKVIVGPDGKVSDLETGAQLCEAVPWAQFRYQPPVRAGHPIKVSTEVEVRFEPRK